jgi:antirestriction protein
MTDTATRRIYVACLASYNNGDPYGEWIDADQGADGIKAAIAKMLRGSKYPSAQVDCPMCDGTGMQEGESCFSCSATGKVASAEQWAIRDYEGFEGINLSEYESIDKVAELAELLAEHGPAYAAFVDMEGMKYATAEDFRDRYQGEWGSETAYAEHLIDEGAMGEIPDAIAPYIDAEKFARDLFIGDYYSIHKDGVTYVFSRN